jgi:hypothetical protein
MQTPFRTPAEIAEDISPAPKKRKPLPHWLKRTALAYVCFLGTSIVTGWLSGSLIGTLGVFHACVFALIGLGALLSLVPSGM